MEALHFIPVIIVRCFQKVDMKSLSWSETMLVGKPFSQYHLSKNKTASSFVVNVGAKMICDGKYAVMALI